MDPTGLTRPEIESIIAALRPGLPNRLSVQRTGTLCRKLISGELDYRCGGLTPEPLTRNLIVLMAPWTPQLLRHSLAGRDAFLAAIRSNGYNLKFVPDKKREMDICLEACKNNRAALSAVPKTHLPMVARTLLTEGNENVRAETIYWFVRSEAAAEQAITAALIKHFGG